MQNNKGLVAVAVILGIALIAALIWGFNRSGEVETLTGENMEINQSLEAMTELRDQLAGEVDSLAVSYSSLASTNEELNGNLASTQTELADAKKAISRAKRNAAAEVNDLKAQIQELMDARAGLETSIVALETENAELRARAEGLETDLAMSKEENAQLASLNSTINSELKRLTLENFKASAFQVDLQRKSSKVTANASRARKIAVSFDLANVPEEYQGVRPVYLVITDETGTPISINNAKKASIKVMNEPVDIMAAEVKDVNIGDSQRLSFTHDLEDKLKAGFYRATVYTDIGMLGASSFRLR